MAKTKRNRNIERSERANQLKAEIRLDPSRVLAYIPDSFVSHKSALRTFKLTENDLTHLQNIAVLGEKRGQEGIFYPVGEIRALAVDKKDQNQIDEKMIPESIISMQIPKNHFDNHYLERFRKFGITGTRRGSRGTFYTEEVIERELGMKVIRPDMIEGTDYIREKSVPDDMRAKLEPPELCIWSDRSYGIMEACYLGVEVSAILSDYWLQDVRRKSKRHSKLPPSSGVLQSSSGMSSGSGVVTVEIPPGEVDPRSEELYFRSGDLSFRSEDLSFRSGDLSFRLDDLSPRPDLTPQAGDLHPQAGDLHPQAGDLHPMPGDLNPMPEEITPRPGNLAIMPADLNPMPEDMTPRPRNLALKPADLTPMPWVLAPMPADLASVPADLNPMPEDLNPMGDNIVT